MLHEGDEGLHRGVLVADVAGDAAGASGLDGRARQLWPDGLAVISPDLPSRGAYLRWMLVAIMLAAIVLYRPEVAVLLNLSLDHKSIEELRVLFGNFVASAPRAALNFDCEETRALAAKAREVLSFGIDNTVTLFERLRLYARVDGNGGHKQVNTEIRATHNQSTTRAVLLPVDQIPDGSSIPILRVVIAVTVRGATTVLVGVVDDDVGLAKRRAHLLRDHLAYRAPDDGTLFQARQCAHRG